MHPFFIAGSGALAAAGTIAYGAVYPKAQLFGKTICRTNSARKLALKFDDLAPRARFELANPSVSGEIEENSSGPGNEQPSHEVYWGVSQTCKYFSFLFHGVQLKVKFDEWSAIRARHICSYRRLSEAILGLDLPVHKLDDC
jgi:hypothetical protein